jgi:hypothetical protein
MPELTGQTDKVLKVQMKSLLLSARWGLAEVAAGGSIPAEVTTAYVSDGSDISLAVKDLEGNTVDTLKGKIYSNLYRAAYRVSKPNKTGGMYFEAELSAHSLKAVSPRVKVGPPVKITALKLLDDKGKELKEISQPSSLEMTAKVEGPSPGTPCNIVLYLDKGRKQKSIVHSAMTEVRDGKASCIWNFEPPEKESEHLVQQDLDKDGEKYAPMNYLFEVECLGVKALSEPVKYVSWVDLDFGGIRGKVVLVMPDGSEETKDIPGDGVLQVAAPGAGRIFLKDVMAEEMKDSGGNAETGAPKKGDEARDGDANDNTDGDTTTEDSSQAPLDDKKSSDDRSSLDQKANFSTDEAVAYLNAHALAKSESKCAAFVRAALQAGGAKIPQPQPQYAKDYGPTLIQIGFQKVDIAGYSPLKGDVAVFQPPSGRAEGHIQMFNGEKWVSDFVQPNPNIYPGPKYREESVSYEIYRP